MGQEAGRLQGPMPYSEFRVSESLLMVAPSERVGEAGLEPRPGACGAGTLTPLLEDESLYTDLRVWLRLTGSLAS